MNLRHCAARTRAWLQQDRMCVHSGENVRAGRYVPENHRACDLLLVVVAALGELQATHECREAVTKGRCNALTC